MGSNLVNSWCILIFVSTSPRVPKQDHVMVETQNSFRASISIPGIQEKLLPLMTSWQQCYSPLCYNDEPFDDNDIVIANVQEEVLPIETSLEQHYATFQNNDDLIDDNSNT